MKRGKECGDGSVTVSYGIRCQLDQLIRNNVLSIGSFSFKSGEAPSFSLPGSTEGTRVLIHSRVMAGWATIAILNFGNNGGVTRSTSYRGSK